MLELKEGSTFDENLTYREKAMASSKLKSMIAPRSHRRGPTDNPTLSPPNLDDTSAKKPITTAPAPLLPPDHPHTRLHLREESRSRDSNARSSPRKPIEVYVDKNKSVGLHKRSKSSVSLKSIISNEKVKTPKGKAPDKQENKKPKKSKSSTSLSSLISRPKSSKSSQADDTKEPREKENLTPPSTGDTVPPPIWAQFASQPFQVYPTSKKIPLNDVELEDEVALYTPQEYSPSKQRNFGDHDHPTLSHRIQTKSRPKSAFLSSSQSQMSFTETLSNLRKRSCDKVKVQPPQEQQTSQDSRQESRKTSSEKETIRRTSTEQQRLTEQYHEDTVPKGKTGSKVMATVAAFNVIAQGSANPKRVSEDVKPRLDPNAINDAFEKLLVCIATIYYHLRLMTLGYEEHTAKCARQDEIAKYEDQSGFCRKTNIDLKFNF